MSITLETLIQSAVGAETAPPFTDLVPMVTPDFLPDSSEKHSEADWVASELAAFLMNISEETVRFDRQELSDLEKVIDKKINAQLNELIHHESFKALEATWRAFEDLVNHTNFRKNVGIDILDVTKAELGKDFKDSQSDLLTGAFFEKLYVHEYDQYGGKPFASILGLYEFDKTPADVAWLQTMARVANAAHAPFIAGVSPKFFGAKDIEHLEAIKDIEGLMAKPSFGDWSAFRESESAAYVGLVFPRHVLRQPWDPDDNPCDEVNFTEEREKDGEEQYLWGNSTALFARNMVKSFEQSGWCQYLRGPKGGGLIKGLPVHAFTNANGVDDYRIPVETTIPDYWELAFARSGFIPLVYRKSTGDAAFFSAQSVKKAMGFKDPNDSKNSQLVTNLCYTFSITRIAHYVKSIMRDNIGSAADEAYIQSVLEQWLNEYVTTVTNPDDLTLRHYPFKACQVDVRPKDGEIGWYDCEISVLPHVQFEGMDVELRLESRLG